MVLYREEAIVLRTQKLGEADRIVTLLGREHGQVRAVAKGVRRVSSRFGARLEPFGHVELQLYRGRTLDTVTQAVPTRSYGAQLSTDYPSWTAACAMSEAAERLTAVGKGGAAAQFLLLVGGLRALVDDHRDSGLVLDAFLLRSLAVSGWSPSFHDCARCGAPGPQRAFHMEAGGAVCPSCRPPGSLSPRAITMELLGALLSGDWGLAESSEERARREGSGLVAAFLHWYLERGLRSWSLVERGSRA